MSTKYSETLMDTLAKNLKEYIDIIDSYLIITGLTREEYKESMHVIKKAIKHLSNHKGDKVFNRKAYLEYIGNKSSVDIRVDDENE